MAKPAFSATRCAAWCSASWPMKSRSDFVQFSPEATAFRYSSRDTVPFLSTSARATNSHALHGDVSSCFDRAL